MCFRRSSRRRALPSGYRALGPLPVGEVRLDVAVHEESIRERARDMDVRIDEPGREQRAARIQSQSPSRRRDQTVVDSLDSTAPHAHRRRFDRERFAVEEAIREHVEVHGVASYVRPETPSLSVAARGTAFALLLSMRLASMLSLVPLLAAISGCATTSTAWPTEAETEAALHKTDPWPARTAAAPPAAPPSEDTAAEVGAVVAAGLGTALLQSAVSTYSSDHGRPATTAPKPPAPPPVVTHVPATPRVGR